MGVRKRLFPMWAFTGIRYCAWYLEILERKKIDYVEYLFADLRRMKEFFAATLGWDFGVLVLTIPPCSGAELNSGSFTADCCSGTAAGTYPIAL